MARLEKRAARLVADFRSALEGCVDPISFGVGWDGAIYVAAHRSTERLTIDEGGSFPKSKHDAPTDYIVLCVKNEASRSMTVAGVPAAVTYVQPYLDGVLLAGARCRWRPEGPEQNAFAVDWSGKEVARFVIGDGVNDLRVTPTGKLWASYFDEGVLGNYGWNGPGPRPLGKAGLVRFGATGTIELEYDRKVANTDYISDAYAMNVVSEDDVWVYFHTEFPLVRVLGGGGRDPRRSRPLLRRLQDPGARTDRRAQTRPLDGGHGAVRVHRQRRSASRQRPLVRYSGQALPPSGSTRLRARELVTPSPVRQRDEAPGAVPDARAD